MKGFELCKSADDKYYMICFNDHESIKNCKENFQTSFHLIPCRLLGLTYDDYLIYCKSKGAKLRGKRGYCYPVWVEETAARSFLKTIQIEWEKLASFLEQND